MKSFPAGIAAAVLAASIPAAAQDYPVATTRSPKWGRIIKAAKIQPE